MKKRLPFFLVTAICLFSPCTRAADTIWGALVLATNEQPSKPLPNTLTSFAPTIRKVFGYDTLYLLGSKKQELDAGINQWLVPSEDFFFQVTCLAREEAHYRLQIEFFHKKNLLLTSEVRLARNAPLYIRGPQWGKGQLILVLEVR